jgi:hypothetical protein
MPGDELLSLAKTLRAHTVKAWDRAERMADVSARQMMCEVAVLYKKLAERLEQESGQAARLPR